MLFTLNLTITLARHTLPKKLETNTKVFVLEHRSLLAQQLAILLHREQEFITIARTLAKAKAHIPKLKHWVSRPKGSIMKRLVCCILIFLLSPAWAWGLDVRAQVDKNRISQEDTVILKVIMEGGDGEVDISPVKDFKVVPRGVSTSISMVNGSYSKTVTHTFLLVPAKEGRLTIPPLQVKSGSDMAYTKTISIQVAPKVPGQKERANVFARAELSSHGLVLGQQAVYTFRLFTRINFSNARLQQPSFDGFTASEMDDRKNYTVNINGLSYQVTEITWLLIPEQAGDLKIEPASVLCEVPVSERGSSRDPFFNNNLFSFGRTRTKTKRVSTNALEVKVEPLPSFLGPGNFSGLVGSFSLGAGLNPDTLAQGESATFTVTISGTGNLMDAPVPELHFPENFKVYGDTPEEKISLTSKGYKGDKTFKWALVPVNPGQYSLKPVTLTYYNTAAGRYETIETPPFEMVVAEDGGAAITLPQVSDDPAPVKKAVEFTGRDILALKEGSGVLVPRQSISFTLFLALLAFPWLILALTSLLFRYGKRETDLSQLLIQKAKSALKQAEQASTGKEFHRYLHTALVARINGVKGIKSESLTAFEAGEILGKHGCLDEVISDVTEVLGETASARYGGETVESEDDKRDYLLKKVKKVFQTLTLVIFLYSGLFSGIFPGILSGSDFSQAWADDAGTQFLKGVEAYKDREFTAAAGHFTEVVNSGIESGAIFYNLGNAFLKADDLGRAILWYERADLLMPQDPDLAFNLNYARGLVKDKKGEEGIRISDIFLAWVDYLPPWALQRAALFIGFIFTLYAGFRIWRKKQVFTLGGGLFFLVYLVFITGALYHYNQNSGKTRAVILSPEAPVRSGLSNSATQLFMLHAGTMVRVEDIQKDYLKIYFDKGKIGWISRGHAETI